MMSYYKQLIAIVFTFFIGVTFAQTQNYWVKKADFGGLKRERAVAFTIGNHAYVGTGIDTSETILNDFWKYDQTTDSWSQVANLAGSPRRNAVAFSIQGYGYVGTGVDNAVATMGTKLNDFWRYDPTSNSWTQVSSMPGAGRYFATGFAIDSKGYVACGKFGPNNYSSQLWEYKPSTDTWVAMPSFPGGVRYQLTSFVVDYVGYVGLGTDQDMYRDDFWAFDATSNTWSQISSLPASERASTMTFSIGQRGYVCMGTNGGYLDDLWEYNPFTDDWAVRANYGGSRRKNAVGFSLNGLGYVGTGKGNSGKKMSFHEYHPVDVLGTSELTADIKVAPNPTTDFVTIASTGNIEEVVILNAYGKEVIRTTNTKNIDLRTFTPGMYHISAIAQNGQIAASQKLIKL